MADTEQIRESIAKNAADAVDSVLVDGVSVRSKDIEEQIKADKYLSGVDAAKRPHRGVRFTKLIPPGTGG